MALVVEEEVEAVMTREPVVEGEEVAEAVEEEEVKF